MRRFEEWTAADFVALATLIGAFFTGIGAILKTFWDWLIKRRQEIREDTVQAAQLDLMEDKDLKDGLKWIAKKQDRQIKKLETEVAVVRMNYTHCMEEHARMSTLYEVTCNQVTELKQKVEEYRNIIRTHLPGPWPSPIPKLPITPPPTDLGDSNEQR